MSNIAIIFIAVGLSLDAFAVAIASGITLKKMHLHHAMLIASFFGFFQALMPLIGWQIGRFSADFVTSSEHWIAFILLTFIGGKMIYEAKMIEQEERVKNPLKIYILFAMAIATSIDALAAGVTLSVLKISIVKPVIIIGTVTFVMSFAGTYIGSHFGHLFEKKLEIIGGLILIGIGCKILLEHYY